MKYDKALLALLHVHTVQVWCMPGLFVQHTHTVVKLTKEQTQMMPVIGIQEIPLPPPPKKKKKKAIK